MSSTENSKLVIGALELPDPERLTGGEHFFVKQTAKELKPVGVSPYCFLSSLVLYLHASRR